VRLGGIHKRGKEGAYHTILYLNMVRNPFPLSLRRKSFDIQEFEKISKKPLTGTVGKDLGFWTTCFLGFQTLGAIYGINPDELTNNIRRYWDKSSLRIYWVSSHEMPQLIV
jgi:hypothetical protein